MAKEATVRSKLSVKNIAAALKKPAAATYKVRFNRGLFSRHDHFR